MEATEVKAVLLAQEVAKSFDIPQFAALLHENSQTMRKEDFNRYLASHDCLGGTTVPYVGIFCVFWEMNKDNIGRKYC